MERSDDTISENIEVVPVVVVSQTFPARPSSIPDIRDFVRKCLAQSPLSEQDTREVGETVSRALLEAAGDFDVVTYNRLFVGELDALLSRVTGSRQRQSLQRNRRSRSRQRRRYWTSSAATFSLGSWWAR